MEVSQSKNESSWHLAYLAKLKRTPDSFFVPYGLTSYMHWDAESRDMHGAEGHWQTCL